MTRRQQAVRAVLAQSEGFRSAQDIYADLRTGGSKIGLTTVYRALQALAANGEVDVLRTGDGESAYRACVTDEHHHHVVCRYCGTTVEVAGPAVERWAEKVGAEHGFVDVTHTVEVFGTCPACASPSGGGPDSVSEGSRHRQREPSDTRTAPLEASEGSGHPQRGHSDAWREEDPEAFPEEAPEEAVAEGDAGSAPP